MDGVLVEFKDGAAANGKSLLLSEGDPVGETGLASRDAVVGPLEMLDSLSEI